MHFVYIFRIFVINFVRLIILGGLIYMLLIYNLYIFLDLLSNKKDVAED